MSASPNSNLSLSGIKAANLDKVNKKYICENCKCILWIPWQLLCCGILLCKMCLRQGLSNREPFVCPYCHENQDKKEGSFDRAVARELNTLSVVCDSCSWSGSYQNYINHLQEMHATLECNACHERFSILNSLEEHKEDLCYHRCVPCGLPNCANSIKWYQMREHYCTDQHLNALTDIVLQYSNPYRQQQLIKNQSVLLQKELSDIQENVNLSISVYETLLNEYNRLQTEKTHIETFLKVFSERLGTDQFKKSEEDNVKLQKKLFETQKAIETILEDTKHMSERSPVHILDDDSTTILTFYRPNTFQFSIHSEKFKTSEYGYTFTIRLCSTIEMDKAYLSIFLTLHNDDYNNLIPFPFSSPMYFILLDQSNQKKHIVYNFKPDPNSPAFMRPTRESNEEYAITQFSALEYITDPNSIYVKDGIFFIRIFIDFLNIGLGSDQLKDYVSENDDDMKLSEDNIMDLC